jgi:hypothetical protein
MSLIQEALKRKLEEQAGLKTSAPPPLPIKPKKSPMPGILAAVVVIILLLAIAGGLILYAGKLWKKKPTEKPVATALKDLATNVAAAHPASIVSNVVTKVSDMKNAVSQFRKDTSAVEGAGIKPVAPPAPTSTPAVAVAPVQTQQVTAVVKTPEPPVEVARAKPKLWPRLTVNGIMSRGENGAAIINNQVVSPGEAIEGARVIDIKERGVTMELEGETRFLGVGQGP